MPFTFSAYGLRLLADAPIPGLVAQTGEPAGNVPGVRVWLAQIPPALAPLWEQPGEPWYTSEKPGAGCEPTLRAVQLGSFFRFRYSDATEFLVAADGSEIAARWPAAMTVEDTATYLLGPILGYALRLRGVTCLHASAVVMGEAAIALAGPPGAGKSTAAAALAQRGLTVLSDDMVALAWRAGRVWAHSGYPRLNLWPDSVAALFGAADRQPLITRGWEKRYVDLPASDYEFATQAVPLAAVYLLDPGGVVGAPRMELVPKPLAIVSVVANTYANYLPGTAQRAQEFAAVGRLVQHVPVRRVRYQPSPEAFKQLPEAILADARGANIP